MKGWSELCGLWRETRHRQQPQVRMHLERLIDDLVAELSREAPTIRQLIVMMGMSKSGKTWLVDHHPQLRHYARLESLSLHCRLNRTFAFLRDDTSITGPAYWERQLLTHRIRRQVLLRLLARGIGIVADSCHLRARSRRHELQLAHRLGYRTTIIWVQCDPVKHYRRLLHEDDRQEFGLGLPRTWWRLYTKVQQSRVEPPAVTEADTIRYYHSGSPITTITLQS